MLTSFFFLANCFQWHCLDPNRQDLGAHWVRWGAEGGLCPSFPTCHCGVTLISFKAAKATKSGPIFSLLLPGAQAHHAFEHPSPHSTLLSHDSDPHCQGQHEASSRSSPEIKPLASTYNVSSISKVQVSTPRSWAPNQVLGGKKQLGSPRTSSRGGSRAEGAQGGCKVGWASAPGSMVTGTQAACDLPPSLSSFI